MDSKEFDAMCRKAGVKKGVLCDTVFTRQFKEEKEQKTIPINPARFDQILKGIGRRKFGKVTTKVKGAIR